jgi:hypothetical protein
MKSICEKCSNKPCRNGEYFENSNFMLSSQFKLKFDFFDGLLKIVECSGFNKKSYVGKDGKITIERQD